MLDIKFIRENKELVAKAAKDKGVKVDIDEVLEVDKDVGVLNTVKQKLQEERNKIAQEKNIEKGKKIKQQLSALEKELTPLEKDLEKLLLEIPNPAKPDVKVGKDETENEVIRKVGTPRKFNC